MVDVRNAEGVLRAAGKGHKHGVIGAGGRADCYSRSLEGSGTQKLSSWTLFWNKGLIPLFINYDIPRDKSTLIPLYDVLQGHCAVRHKAELHRGFHGFRSPKESDDTVVEQQ